MQKIDKRIILASASPRRKEILTEMGLRFEIMPADIDESAISAANPRSLVKKLSYAKAFAIEDTDAVIIGADTVVVMGGKVFGKPHTDQNARAMLEKLCGRWHTVYTGVTVRLGSDFRRFAVRSYVKLKKLSGEEIKSCVADTNPLDKAGAYGIQDGRVVEKYRGSYTNIVGLPEEKLARVLAGFGVTDGNR